MILHIDNHSSIISPNKVKQKQAVDQFGSPSVMMADIFSSFFFHTLCVHHFGGNDLVVFLEKRKKLEIGLYQNKRVKTNTGLQNS